MAETDSAAAVRRDESDFVRLAHPSGSSARIALHGAQVVSWVDPGGKERLYLSSRSRYGRGDAIRGGVPVIFPQFAVGPLPKHGFLRTRRWSLMTRTESRAIFQISDDVETRTLWPYPFLAELVVELAATLTVALRIINTGDSPFTFTAALHNYFHVSNVTRAAVQGLTGLTYVDKVAGGSRHVEVAPELCLSGETDRIYAAGPRRVAITSAVGSSSTTVEADGFGDWVVWNPWRELTATLADMEPEDYLEMVCVEAGRITDPVSLAPGTAWCGEEVLGST